LNSGKAKDNKEVTALEREKFKEDLKITIALA